MYTLGNMEPATPTNVHTAPTVRPGALTTDETAHELRGCDLVRDVGRPLVHVGKTTGKEA